MKLLKPFASLFFILLFTFDTLPSYAWGNTGHRAVGEIAEQLLNRKARKALKKLLDNESLAYAGTYMDEIRSDRAFDSLYTWHFVTIPDGKTYADIEKEPAGDIIEAIHRMIDDLKSDRLSIEEKAFAVKILAHLIGDIHQPLHVGRPGDKGGNTVQVQWHYISNYNLHKVWDEGMIDFSNLSYTEISDNILRVTSEEQVEDWQSSTPEQWALESMSYRESLYDIGDGKLGYNYNYIHFPIVQHRIAQAGARLAGVLNEIFG